MDPDAGARHEALETLTNLLEWRLTTAEWQPVGRVLDDLEAAVRGGDLDRLARLNADLEALSPLRIAPIDLAYPVPVPLLLKTNMLIHTLADETTPPAALRSAAPVPLPAAGSGVRQEYVVHAFAPMDGPWAEAAYQQVRLLWGRAERVLGASAALGGPPVDLPPDGLLVTSGPLLAARQRPDRTAQMMLRREHDALVLSIGWRADPGEEAPGWAAAEHQWSEIAHDETGELLGVARLRVGVGAPEGDPVPGGASLGAVTVWELPPFDDHARAQRTLLAMAPAADEAALGALVWSDGGPAMPPLARYLLDAAKVRYELRVRRAAGPALRAAVRSGSERELGTLMSRLDDLRLTVGIARSNLAKVRSAAGADADPPAGLFADDLGIADWMDETLADDLHYLGNARDRARHGGPPAARAAEPVIGIVTAMPEEYAAMAALLDDTAGRTIDGDGAPYLAGFAPSADDGPPHPVVLTLLGGTGNVDAAANVAHLLRSFPTVREVLMVGIAAGIPSPRRPGRHVRLGDIVVATWGVVDFDHVVDRPDGVALRVLGPRPSYVLGNRAELMAADVLRSGRRPWEDELDRLIGALPDFARPDEAADVLYASDEPDAERIEHPPRDASGHRPGRPKVHFGRIGSANRSLRNARARDALAEKYEIRAGEMEGAGVSWSAHSAARSWLVIRGISDYADSRMATNWRNYAAGAAAAYARALLGRLPAGPAPG